MVDKVSVDNLADAIARAVSDYTEDVSAAIERKVEDVAQQVLRAAISAAPKRSGKYAKGFKVTRDGSRRIIWNKKDYRRVHLLEFGHAKVNGGRVAAMPHLRPAYDRYGAQLPAHITRIIRNGGGS